MLTGKIYKNKLSPYPQQHPHTQPHSHPNQTLPRIKSQPGLKPHSLDKPEQPQNIDHGTVRNQRNRLLQQFNAVSEMNTLTKIMGNQVQWEDGCLGACEQVLEYQRKIREHVRKIQGRYEGKIGYMETALQAKNQIIQQLKNSLKQKQILIEKLTQQAKTLQTSRLNTQRHK